MIQVRKVQPKDLDYLYTNNNELFFEQKQMSSKLENMMVALDNNQICGVGFFINSEDRCYINWVHIKTGYRRNKLGTMLVKTMLSNAEQKGALQALLHIDCMEFAEFLDFQRVTNAEEELRIKTEFDNLYNEKPKYDIYKVSLIDYFKPCCHSK